MDAVDEIHISVVLPIFNESDAITELLAKIRAALDPLGQTYEVICCDDGSTDRTLELLRAEAERDPRIKVIVFARNYGQTAALDAGFRAARGQVIVPMDADLQNDPADIPRLVARLDEGWDVVSGWRRDRKDPFFTKTLPSRVANVLVSRVTGVRLHDYGCTLKAYRASVLKGFRLYGEMHRLIPAYVRWVGGKVSEEVVQHHPRRTGRSKYTLAKTLRLLLDLLTVRFLLSYSTKPLYFLGKYGILFIVLGFLAGGWSLAKRIFFDVPLYKDPFFPVAITLTVTGIQLIFFGLLAELSMRTYFEAAHRPPYLIRETLNLPPQG